MERGAWSGQERHRWPRLGAAPASPTTPSEIDRPSRTVSPVAVGWVGGREMEVVRRSTHEAHEMEMAMDGMAMDGTAMEPSVGCGAGGARHESEGVIHLRPPEWHPGAAHLICVGPRVPRESCSVRPCLRSGFLLGIRYGGTVQLLERAGLASRPVRGFGIPLTVYPNPQSHPQEDRRIGGKEARRPQHQRAKRHQGHRARRE